MACISRNTTTPSRTHKCQQRAVISPIRRVQGVQIALPHITLGNQVTRAPGKALRAMLHQQQVRNGTRKAAVTVGKGMNRYQPVAEPRSDFIQRIALVFDLRFHVLAEIVQGRLDLERVDPDILLRGTE